MTTEQPSTDIDYDDTRFALAHHVSGDEYIIEEATVWRGNTCIGTRIIRVAGPITHRNLPERTLAAVAAVAALVTLSDEDADWLQSEEDAGRVTYPLGIA